MISDPGPTTPSLDASDSHGIVEGAPQTHRGTMPGKPGSAPPVSGGGPSDAAQEKIRSGQTSHMADDNRSEADRAADEALGLAAGLTGAQAADRLSRYGPNALVEHHKSVVMEFLSHFWGPIAWMIEAALVLTAVTGRWPDFVVIAALLLMNGVVGFWEEHQAQSAISVLKEQLAKQARVLRDGVWETVPAENLVPGDLVKVGRGNIVPADGLIVDGRAEADESALTGESMPVEKGPGQSLFSGSSLSRGNPSVRVLATGAHTGFGRTAALAGQQQPTSHFQQAVISIGKYLIMLAVVLVVVIVVVELVRGASLPVTLEFALVVTIASVPIALPAVLSVTMAVGARHLAEHGAVVSHLPAVEEMAGVDILCADKTGTITKNQIALADVAVMEPDSDRDAVLLAAALTIEGEGTDPIDAAIRVAAGDVTACYEILEFEPFDAIRKRAQSRVRDGDGHEFLVAKGAVQAIVDLTGHRSERAASKLSADFASKGYRTLAVARAQDNDWRMIGMLALQDPPRDDSRDTLQKAAVLGLTVKMITGDRVEIARQVAGQVGLGNTILEADAISDLKGEALAVKTEQADGFAEVVPEDKFRIVQALQEHGHIVGMTGDGVNDAPALHRADVGIAVAGATDAARAAADIVFLAPGLAAIIEAIHRAREVFRRMQNYSIYRIAETIRIVCSISAAILLFAFFPVTPMQIVLLAVLNDAAILSIAYDRVQASPKPVRWDLREVIAIAAVLGGVGIISTTAMVWIAHEPLGLSLAVLQTLMYLKLSVAGHLTVFVARTRGRMWSHRPSWVLLGAVIGTQIIATIIAATGFLMPAPLPWRYIALAWGYAAVWALVLDQAKILTYRFLDRRAAADVH